MRQVNDRKLHKHVFWEIQGAVTLNNYSTFNGTIVCNNGALGAINTGVVINGRLLTTDGALTNTAITAAITSGCGAPTGITPIEAMGESITVYPNPFGNVININISTGMQTDRYEVAVYDMIGEAVRHINITDQLTTIDAGRLPAGIYLCKIISNGQVVKTQKLISAN